MNVTMPHLIAKQMCGCVQLRHHCAISVAKKMIFEIDAELAFDLAGGVFERIDRLDSAVWQTIHQICGDRRKFCVIDVPRQYENLRLSQE